MRLLFLLVLMVAACNSHYSKPPALPTGTQQVSPVGPPPEQLPGSHYSAPGQHPEPSSERLTGSVSSHHRSVRSTWNGSKRDLLSLVGLVLQEYLGLARRSTFSLSPQHSDPGDLLSNNYVSQTKSEDNDDDRP
ncbi:hypothetical protein Hamer_G005320, partial [Homarus americanus]